DVAQSHLERDWSGPERSRWSITQAEASTLPFDNTSFDLAVAGWVYGHTIKWQPDNWQAAILAALAEARRVLVPQGRLIVFETLGTAQTEPGPPNAGMREYYALLRAQGFRQTILSTDYQFADVDTAARVCGFFFGQTKADRIREQDWARVPEWTGMWIG
ncbi:MAG: methyltransferase domain-containing protein, partial [Nannocystaceae bacterium]